MGDIYNLDSAEIRQQLDRVYIEEKQADDELAALLSSIMAGSTLSSAGALSFLLLIGTPDLHEPLHYRTYHSLFSTTRYHI